MLRAADYGVTIRDAVSVDMKAVKARRAPLWLGRAMASSDAQDAKDARFTRPWPLYC
jgi:hypothetical protein